MFAPTSDYIVTHFLLSLLRHCKRDDGKPMLYQVVRDQRNIVVLMQFSRLKVAASVLNTSCDY